MALAVALAVARCGAGCGAGCGALWRAGGSLWRAVALVALWRCDAVALWRRGVAWCGVARLACNVSGRGQVFQEETQSDCDCVTALTQSDATGPLENYREIMVFLSFSDLFWLFINYSLV